MAPVTDRRAGILRIIVREYVETAAPVGSRTIHDKYGVSASPATIRHEMQALEEEGLLEQPHTSAGRVPSDRGYRLFVESLMGQTDLPVEEKATIRHQFYQAAPELDEWGRSGRRAAGAVAGTAGAGLAAALARTAGQAPGVDRPERDPGPAGRRAAGGAGAQATRAARRPLRAGRVERPGGAPQRARVRAHGDGVAPRAGRRRRHRAAVDRDADRHPQRGIGARSGRAGGRRRRDAGAARVPPGPSRPARHRDAGGPARDGPRRAPGVAGRRRRQRDDRRREPGRRTPALLGGRPRRTATGPTCRATSPWWGRRGCATGAASRLCAT